MTRLSKVLFVPEAVADVRIPQPRIQAFKRLLKGVTEEAAKQGICEDVLFGSSYAIPESEPHTKSLEKELVRLRKSFTVKEEFLISQHVLRDAAQSGQHMGFALMFCLGLRNEEACGLDFGDIKPMQYHPKCSCLWVYKSTKRGTNQLQASGKTRNMARLLPIPGVLLELLEERRRLIQEKVDAGQIILPKNATIDQLPIVCSDFDYLERCNSKQLTAAGRQILKAVKLRKTSWRTSTSNWRKIGWQKMVSMKRIPPCICADETSERICILGFDRGGDPICHGA